jgi:hypothetical protein
MAFVLVTAVCRFGLGADFQGDIRPLLSNACFKCHGPDAETREGDLRLDVAEEATSDRGGYFVIAPGDPAASELLARVTSDDPYAVMPPAESGQRLSAQQVALLKQWISDGAPYDAHWAFQPIQRPPIPGAADATHLENPIDAFVLRRLCAEQIEPSPRADRYALIRRLYLDLLGLPPTPAEADAFVNDDRPAAYERLVDRVLASPRYGERWGRHWLDQARYGDTNGYTIDSPRSIWPYRDWVIAALNRDLPFNQFTVEQLAGDLLPAPTQDQRIATGFHRNTLVNQEGGTDAEQFRNEAVVDRVNTTGAVWLGLTVGCAQCHNHKYDPLSTREFYQLFAFFNSGRDVNSVTPTLSVANEEQRKRLADLDVKIRNAREALERYERALDAKRPQDERDDGKPIVWTTLRADVFHSAAGAEAEQLEDDSILVRGLNAETDEYQITASTEPRRITAVRLEVLTHPSLPKGGPGRAANGNFVLNEIRLTRNDDPPVAWQHASADHSQKDYDITHTIDGDPASGWAINVTKGRMNVNRSATLVLAEPLASTGGDRLTFRLVFGDKPPRYNIGRFRLSVTDAAYAKFDLPDAERLARKRQLEEAQTERKQFAAKIPSTMVMEELPTPRATHVLIRGDFLRQGEPVKPATPSFLPTMKGGLIANRVDLAKWLTSRENPLTARVTVNRIWMRYFGRGLVETENDFGMQGRLPTHPELLDWLAAEFMESGWSLKRLHRLIVTSATYCRSSHARPDLRETDPLNKLLARQSRLRVEAEIVRDLALGASGLLSNRMGGPSVYPPQPSGVYAFTQRKAAWPTSQGQDRYRRGMYTFFMRSAPHPLFETFDAPKFNTTCTRRTRSNTPLQAMAMANDQAMVEMAQALAVRILRESPGDDTGRIRRAFRHCLTRLPADREVERLVGFLNQQRQAFVDEGSAAKQLAGDTMVPGIPTAEVAAWTAVARVVLNLDEFITRE